MWVGWFPGDIKAKEKKSGRFSWDSSLPSTLLDTIRPLCKGRTLQELIPTVFREEKKKHDGMVLKSSVQHDSQNVVA